MVAFLGHSSGFTLAKRILYHSDEIASLFPASALLSVTCMQKNAGGTVALGDGFSYRLIVLVEQGTALLYLNDDFL